MGEKPNFKNRSVAIVVRNGKILMERLCYKDANKGKEFFSVPGGGIEEGESPEDAVTGYDPEEVGSDNPGLREVIWKSLNEINEKDRAFLFSYGLIQVQSFYETIVGWGDEISYPGLK